MNARLTAYVTAVAAAGGGVLALGLLLDGGLNLPSMLFWVAICLAAEALWLRTMQGQATWAMTPTFHLAMAILFFPAHFLPVIFLSRSVGDLLFRKSPWYKALFNGSQFTLSAAGAWAAYWLAGGSALKLHALTDPRTILPLLALGVTHFLLNTLLVSIVVAIDQKQSISSTWKTNFGYRSEAASSGTQFVMAVLLASLYNFVGHPAVVLFLVPLLAIRLADMRYIELQQTQQVMVRSARMAAKGEMAAEVAHEANNYLASLSGRAQLLMMGLARGNTDKIEENIQVILDQAERLAVLTKGLVDFSHKGMKALPTDVNALVDRTVQFLKPQNRFDNVTISVDQDVTIPLTMLDPGQIQQVLMNLLTNAADAIKEDPSGGPKQIEITTKHLQTRKQIRIVVCDTGPGIPEDLLDKVFEPTFTTKDSGHGFGLSTSYRIIENHGGHISVKNHKEKGAVFTMVVPIRRSKEVAEAA
jgi:signal transduction histidine kinase